MSRDDAYGSIAKFYDFFVGVPLRGVRRSITTFTPGEGPVVDIGCGTGEQSAQMANKKRHVVGIDASPAMLAQAEKRDLPNTTFILGDGGKTEFPDAHFTAAVLNFVLHETDPDSRVALISEAKRLVGPDGTIVIAEYELAKGTWAGFLGLGIHLVERLAGKQHYQGYRNWMRNGSLSGFCARHGLQMQDTRKHFAGNIVVARCTLATISG